MTNRRSNVNKYGFLSVGTVISVMIVIASVVKASDMDINASLKEIESKRLSHVKNGLQISGEKEGIFADIYNEYRGEMKKLIETEVDLLVEYSDAYKDDALTDQKASSLLNKRLELDTRHVMLTDKWMNRFAEVLSPKELARLYQLEKRFDVEIDCSTVNKIPLVK